MPAIIVKEICPLTASDCFQLFSRTKSEFDFPFHYHEAYELNFIMNARSARRIVGDHIAEIDDMELVLVGPNLQHGWFTHKCRSQEIQEITIQFHRDLFDPKFLHRNQLVFIRHMLEKSIRGLLFSQETTHLVAPRLLALPAKYGFGAVLEFMSILHDLSVSDQVRLLSYSTFNGGSRFSYDSRRIETVMTYLNEHFEKNITLREMAGLANMTDAAFSRFFKARTGSTFIDSLTEIRLGHASRLLVDTTQSIAEVAWHCGFHNISNFNRIFKKKKGSTPKAFRESYSRAGKPLAC